MIYKGIHGVKQKKVMPVCDLMANGQGGISGTAGTSGARATVPGLCNFRFCCWRSRCSCSACTVAKICSCCAMKSDVFGLPHHRFSVRLSKVEKKTLPHSENPHDDFTATDFFLLLFLSLTVFDGPEVPL